jgi:hypothetical protein
VLTLSLKVDECQPLIYGNDPQLVELYGYDSSEKQTGIAFAALATVGRRELKLVETRVASA